MAKIKVIFGDNGQGKTRYLLNYYSQNVKHKHMAIISNSIVNPFPEVEINNHHYFRIRSSQVTGANYKHKSINDYFVELIKDNSWRGMSNVCELIGYSDEIVVRREPIYKIRKTDDDHNGNHQYEIVYSTFGKEINYGSGFLKEINDGVREKFGRFLTSSIDIRFNSSKSLSMTQYFNDHLYEELELKKILGFARSKPLFINQVYVNKEIGFFEVENASSGELYMLSLGLFIGKFLNEDTILPKVILIDEPENSLHPKWQRKYIEYLVGFLGYKDDTEIIIATHSPFISMENDLYSAEISLYHITNGSLHPANHKQKNNNIEQVYYELFGVLTPKNRYLSEYCSKLVRDVAEGNVKYTKACSAIRGMREAAFDEKQSTFLAGVLALLEKVHGDVND
ncbi:AAA family ATPase [Pantoea agglomerans]|uniref:AAA family ATPase n=1 Tax=Enterobacter agglomerans TaxID=549 RepID=UPI0013BA8D58|nr:AAA family ATPase [Pantoea agglomerans]NEG87274.1 AAA family ATPase [Pantoea agglomerans]NEH09608.1 AAA family ATPase [Pantoea agglomerans]